MSDLGLIQRAYANCNKYARLYHCTAYVYKTVAGLYALKSYETFVAVYNPKNRKLTVFGRFSHTTYTHVGKFKRWLNENGYSIESETNLELVNWFRKGK